MALNTGVYGFFNPETDEAYVGSGRDVDQRGRTHLTKLRSQQHVNSRFQEAFNRNPNFEFVSVPTSDRNEAFDLEQAIIDEYAGNPLLLNMSLNARHCNVVCSDETKRKLSESNKGMKRSEETKERIRQARLGVRHSEETKDKLRDQKLGTTLSEETRAKMSESRKGMVMPPRSEEHLARIKESRSGYQHDEETIKRIRESAPNAKPVVLDGVTYPSFSEAARCVGVSVKTIKKRLG